MTMNFADIVLWLLVTFAGAGFLVSAYASTMFSGTLGKEGWFLVVVGCGLAYFSYDLWPFQMAMRVAQ